MKSHLTNFLFSIVVPFNLNFCAAYLSAMRFEGNWAYEIRVSKSVTLHATGQSTSSFGMLLKASVE